METRCPLIMPFLFSWFVSLLYKRRLYCYSMNTRLNSVGRILKRKEIKRQQIVLNWLFQKKGFSQLIYTPLVPSPPALELEVLRFCTLSCHDCDLCRLFLLELLSAESLSTIGDCSTGSWIMSSSTIVSPARPKWKIL